jgi:hypothetical protein
LQVNPQAPVWQVAVAFANVVVHLFPQAPQLFRLAERSMHVPPQQP